MPHLPYVTHCNIAHWRVVKQNVTAINMKSVQKPYHRGDTSNALLDAVAEIVRRNGIEGVTISAAAAAIGVSHAAVFRHYADKRALLTAYATRSANQLASFMEIEAVDAENPRVAFYKTGVGYIRFAVERPEAFRAVFRDAMLDAGDPAYRAAMMRLQELLFSGSKQPSGKDAVSMSTSALLAWGATHGLATLAADGALDDLPIAFRSTEGLADALALLSKAIE